MQCFIYKSLKKEDLYLYIDKKDDFSKVPEMLFNSFGRMTFVMELELTPERKLAREDAGKVITSLKEKGFFVQMPPTRVEAPLKVQ
ncbi:YcgL domain-containing protein [Methylobacter sp. BlB1]|uniref:YcgL domain-containing protein n=1 Tax=Methylobacter sp. BlB1 TaxID=2785914 RepID=UPI001896171E|nr:YcgL domain-containing protein [Methylobacter sp. BlB1]MBF6647037.1 YcgL domain-containing protein [Methylobacter sp. BlB1]